MSTANLDDMTQLQQVHERAMHAMTVSILCSIRKRPVRKELALRYALKWELQAVNIATLCHETATACMLRKSAVAIAGKVGELSLARQLMDEALAQVPLEEKVLLQDLRAANTWLQKLEADAGICVKRSWLARLLS